MEGNGTEGRQPCRCSDQMIPDLFIVDDPVREPPSRAETERMCVLAASCLPAIVRRGSYRNKAGDLVTWGASEDGSHVFVQTWPECRASSEK